MDSIDNKIRSDNKNNNAMTTNIIPNTQDEPLRSNIATYRNIESSASTTSSSSTSSSSSSSSSASSSSSSSSGGSTKQIGRYSGGESYGNRNGNHENSCSIDYVHDNEQFGSSISRRPCADSKKIVTIEAAKTFCEDDDYDNMDEMIDDALDDDYGDNSGYGNHDHQQDDVRGNINDIPPASCDQFGRYKYRIPPDINNEEVKEEYEEQDQEVLANEREQKPWQSYSEPRLPVTKLSELRKRQQKQQRQHIRQKQQQTHSSLSSSLQNQEQVGEREEEQHYQCRRMSAPPAIFHDRCNMYNQLMELPEDEPPHASDDDENDNKSKNINNFIINYNSSSSSDSNISASFNGRGQGWDYCDGYYFSSSQSKKKQPRRRSIVDMQNDVRFKFMFESTVLVPNNDSGSSSKKQQNLREQDLKQLQLKQNQDGDGENPSSIASNNLNPTKNFADTLTKKKNKTKRGGRRPSKNNVVVPIKNTVIASKNKVVKSSSSNAVTNATTSALERMLMMNNNSNSVKKQTTSPIGVGLHDTSTIVDSCDSNTTTNNTVNSSPDDGSSSKQSSVDLILTTYPYSKYWNGKTAAANSTNNDVIDNGNANSNTSTTTSIVIKSNSNSNSIIADDDGALLQRSTIRIEAPPSGKVITSAQISSSSTLRSALTLDQTQETHYEGQMVTLATSSTPTTIASTRFEVSNTFSVEPPYNIDEAGTDDNSDDAIRKSDPRSTLEQQPSPPLSLAQTVDRDINNDNYDRTRNVQSNRTISSPSSKNSIDSRTNAMVTDNRRNVYVVGSIKAIPAASPVSHGIKLHNSDAVSATSSRKSSRSNTRLVNATLRSKQSRRRSTGSSEIIIEKTSTTLRHDRRQQNRRKSFLSTHWCGSDEDAANYHDHECFNKVVKISSDQECRDSQQLPKQHIVSKLPCIRFRTLSYASSMSSDEDYHDENECEENNKNRSRFHDGDKIVLAPESSATTALQGKGSSLSPVRKVSPSRTITSCTSSISSSGEDDWQEEFEHAYERSRAMCVQDLAVASVNPIFHHEDNGDRNTNNCTTDQSFGRPRAMDISPSISETSRGVCVGNLGQSAQPPPLRIRLTSDQDQRLCTSYPTDVVLNQIAIEGNVSAAFADVIVPGSQNDENPTRDDTKQIFALNVAVKVGSFVESSSSSVHSNESEKLRPKRKMVSPTKYKKSLRELLSTLPEDPPGMYTTGNVGMDGKVAFMFESTTLQEAFKGDDESRCSTASSKQSLQFVPRSYPFSKYWKVPIADNQLEQQPVHLPSNNQGSWNKVTSKNPNSLQRHKIKSAWSNHGEKVREGVHPVYGSSNVDTVSGILEDAPWTNLGSKDRGVGEETSSFMFESVMLDADDASRYSDSSRNSLKLVTRTYPFSKYWNVTKTIAEEFERSMNFEQLMTPQVQNESKFTGKHTQSLQLAPIFDKYKSIVGSKCDGTAKTDFVLHTNHDDGMIHAEATLPEDVPWTKEPSTAAELSAFMFESTMLDADDASRYSDSSRHSIKLVTRSYPFAKYWNPRTPATIEETFERSLNLELFLKPKAGPGANLSFQPEESFLLGPIADVHESIVLAEENESTKDKDSFIKPSALIIGNNCSSAHGTCSEMTGQVSSDPEDLCRESAITKRRKKPIMNEPDSPIQLSSCIVDSQDDDSSSSADPCNQLGPTFVPGENSFGESVLASHQMGDTAELQITDQPQKKTTSSASVKCIRKAKTAAKPRRLSDRSSSSSTEEPTTSHNSMSSDLNASSTDILVMEEIQPNFNSVGVTIQDRRRSDDYISIVHRRQASKYVPPRPLHDALLLDALSDSQSSQRCSSVP